MSFLDIFGRKNWEKKEQGYIEREKMFKKEISDLKSDMEYKSQVIMALKDEIDKVKDKKINPKQVDLVYKNLQDTKHKYDTAIKSLEELKEKNDGMERFLKRYNLKYSDENYYYRVEVERFFTSAKSKDIISYFKDRNIFFIDDINMDEFKELDLKNVDEAIKKLEKFRSGEFIEWDIVTYLNKGDRVTKLFQKSRKLLNIFAMEDIEYMEDIKNYDFSKLLIENFKPAMVKELEAIRDDYYKERRVVK